MRTYGSRIVKVNKQKLIDKIKENKENHIIEFDKAVVAYKEEATKQLLELTAKNENDEMNLKLNLVTPINASEDYEKIIEMFEWEVETEVELEQKEFNQYVQDETEFAINAKFSNSTYLMG